MPWSYLICGTPRTGSTLLCALLASTGVAGRPESYFREQDEPAWARRLGVPPTADRLAFVRAVRRAGSTPNGVFAARVMWGTMPRLVTGLDPADRDLDTLVAAFGPLRFVHLRRDDVVGQAVSWARAEQTGYWQPGDRAAGRPRADLDQVDHLVRTIGEHDAAWRSWFAAQGVEPWPVRHEDLVADPQRTVQGIADHLGVALPAGWRPAAPHRKQADEVNADWVRRYRARRVELRPVVPAGDLARELLRIQHAAYAVEAGLIGDDRIPTLHEDLDDLCGAPLSWLAAVVVDGTVVGAVGWTEEPDGVDIDRLLVDPAAHRQGVGSTLVRAVLARGRRTTVSTGRDNGPARALYERLGFAHTGDAEVLPGLWVARYTADP